MQFEPRPLQHQESFAPACGCFLFKYQQKGRLFQLCSRLPKEGRILQITFHLREKLFGQQVAHAVIANYYTMSVIGSRSSRLAIAY